MILIPPAFLTAVNAKTKEQYFLIPAFKLVQGTMRSTVLEDIVRCCNEPHIKEQFFQDAPYTAATAEDWANWVVRRWENQRSLVYLILRDTSVVGSLELHEVPRSGEIGYWLSKSASGVMSPAVCALHTAVMKHHPEHVLFAFTKPDNLASQRVLLRSRFRQKANPYPEKEGRYYFER